MKQPIGEKELRQREFREANHKVETTEKPSKKALAAKVEAIKPKQRKVKGKR